MAITKLVEMCGYLQGCAEQLEEEIKTSINDCSNKVSSKTATEVEMALEKAKDFHYKEIIQILGEIATSIKKIFFHEEKIKKLNNNKEMSDDDIKNYSYVKRQIEAFSSESGNKVVTRRDLRRAASEVSIYSLNTWNQYLENKEMEEEKVLESASSLPNINAASKRKTHHTRKHKKLISSTFNDILDDNGFVSGSLGLLKEEESPEDTKSETCVNAICGEEVNDEMKSSDEMDTKPKIVGVVYKK